MLKIRISKIIENTEVEGIGNRFCLWVQGCSIRCEGCANRALWDKTGGIEYETDKIISLIANNKDKIEGITVLGGEPLEQIAPLLQIIKAAKMMGLSVIVFTGYKLDEIQGWENPLVEELLENTDILIDGRFEKDKFDLSRPWVGSSNQKFHFLTERYSEKDLSKYTNKFELRIKPNGTITANGMGNVEILKNALRERVSQ